MRFETIIMHVLGATISLFVAWQYYLSVEQPEMDTVSKLQISTERRDPINRGEMIDDRDITEFRIQVPPERVSDFDYALDFDENIKNALIGQRLSQSVSPGTLIERRFFFDGTLQDFAARVAPGNRAFSVEIRRSDSIMNFIGPGSLVDVIAAIPSATGALVSTALLENVEVMAIGPVDNLAELDPEEVGNYRSMTFQGAPAQIDRYLRLAPQVEGDLLVTLRAPGDAPKP